ncbi:patatin-like phospholipase family protein [Actinomadura rayongensis]|uniref:Patatin-like phospholipase family protein n=1 Tax=Actinomadura rayongensis TaxID=1429076 RepID=A0A6I4W4R0_9ACTN|nr:patatin-like phospholipase family protein [Actinomadura rayongensis]MXQ65177.1 patatin-like phospholipase family protein [Actinomadura rayongensis]
MTDVTGYVVRMARALILGAGGTAGALWQAGLVEGFRRAGTDLGDADLVVATGASPVTGALVLSDLDLERSIREVVAVLLAGPSADVEADRLLHVIDVLADPSVPADERRQRVGRMARGSHTAAAHRMDDVLAVLPSGDWPDRLLVPTVDVESGARAVWGRDGAATLAEAFRASDALPTVFPPVEIGGRHHMNGIVYSQTHADLAAGHDRVVVLAPLRHVLGGALLAEEIGGLGAARSLVVGPGGASREIFAVGVIDTVTGTAPFHAGLRDAEAYAADVAEVWS